MHCFLYFPKNSYCFSQSKGNPVFSPGLNTKQVFTMPMTHWPNCAFSQKCLPKEENETSSSFHSQWNSNPLTLLVFEREKTECKPLLTVRKTLNQQCLAYSATGSSGLVSKEEPGQNCVWDRGRGDGDAVNLAWSNGQIEEIKIHKFLLTKWQRGSINQKRFILNSILGEPLVMIQQWNLRWWMSLPLGTDIQGHPSFPKL